MNQLAKRPDLKKVICTPRTSVQVIAISSPTYW
jgi:hypothetical protein